MKASPSSKETRQVLIVEDNVAFAELIAETLREEGYICDTATTGSAAISWLQSHQTSLVIMDYSLSDMSGDDLISSMRDNGFNMPFVVVTGRDDSELAVQMIKQGASDFVLKDTTLLDRLPVVALRALKEAEIEKQLVSAEEALRQSEARLARAQKIARIGSWEWNIKTNAIFFSDELLRILGYNPETPPAISMEWLYERINPVDIPAVRKAIANTVESRRPLNIAYRINTASGSEIMVSSQGELESDEYGRPSIIIGATIDITARSKAEEEIHLLVNYDTLTGLPNRNLLNDRLQQAIANSSRSEQVVGILFLDLDRFKSINDSLGHKAGDQLLRIVAERLRSCIRESDTLARLGGDEFVLILSGTISEDGITTAAGKILAIIAEPFMLEGREIYLTASVGIAVYPVDGEEVHTLLKHADLAMYKAKEMDRNNFQFFSSDMNIKVMEKMVLENALRRALERMEFELLYQPQVDTRLKTIVGFEALLRWHHPDLGLISPDKFIPLAEETGLIIAIGEWVITTACKQAKIWKDMGLPVRTAVNLSGRQFRTDLDQTVRSILMETGIEADLLELEMTESILMKNAAQNMQLLKSLSALGCIISIDDFGTGYSSLAYLKNFPVGRLKIDRTFVRDITTNPDDVAIAKVIIDMAHTLRMRVTAEGVEEIEQLDLLSAYGCTEVQGFFFSRPLNAENATKLLKEGIRF